MLNNSRKMVSNIASGAIKNNAPTSPSKVKIPSPQKTPPQRPVAVHAGSDLRKVPVSRNLFSIFNGAAAQVFHHAPSKGMVMTPDLAAKYSGVTPATFVDSGSIRAINYLVEVATEESLDAIEHKIRAIIRDNPSSIIVITEPSRLLTNDNVTDRNKWRTLHDSEVTESSIAKLQANGSKLRVEPGHISFVATDSCGSMSPHLQVSFRPDKGTAPVLEGGKSLSYPQLYPDGLPVSIAKGVYTRIDDELSKLATTLYRSAQQEGQSLLAHITAIPHSAELLSHQQLDENIAETKKQVMLYHLMTGKYPKEKLAEIETSVAGKAINDLIKQAKETPQLKELAESCAGQSIIIAACVCNHAVISALKGSHDHLDELLTRDFPTQSAAAYVIASILGTNNSINHDFIGFAKECNLLDPIGSLGTSEPSLQETEVDDENSKNHLTGAGFKV